MEMRAVTVTLLFEINF